MTFLFTTPSFAGPDFKTIDTPELHSMVVDNAYRLESGKEQHYPIIDARTKKEYDNAHIFSAISIPEKDVSTSINLLPKNKDELLVVYGNDAQSAASKTWAGKALAAGYTNIAIYSEGFTAWQEKKMPIAPFTSSK